MGRNDCFFFHLYSYYGLWFWFPELFNRLENFYRDNPNVTASVCQVVNYKADNSTDEDPFMHCKNPTPPSSEVFINAFIVALAPLPANIWTIYHMDKLGRKFFLGILFNLRNFLLYFFLPFRWQASFFFFFLICNI